MPAIEQMPNSPLTRVKAFLQNNAVFFGDPDSL